MAIRATAGFALLRYDPGNPEFPTLPDGIPTPHVHTWGSASGLRARARIVTRNKRAAAPATDNGQYAGWQTETTWVNPYIVDFGVIPSPVQRTVSLYNSRRTSITVTGLSLPTGVSLLDSLPVTLDSFAGFTFTLEASTTGDNTFDEIVFFTTSEGLVPVRMIGRRVFTLESIPQTPMRETLYWRTDLIRSRDGTEKAYSLLQAPNAQVEYRVFYDQDDNTARAKLRNQFIAGESALVVAGQKWYETRRLRDAAITTDTFLNVDATLKWTIGAGQTISVVTEDGATVASSVVDSIEFAPDPDYLSSQLVLHFDGSQGQRTTVDSSVNNYAATFWDNGSPPKDYIDTSQSVFGGSSLYLSGTKAAPDKYLSVQTYPNAQITDEDFTIEFWVRPQAYPGNPMIVSQWRGSAGSPTAEQHRGWYIQILSSTGVIRFGSNQGGTKLKDFTTGSPVQKLELNVWQHVAICRTAGSKLRCYVDGVQFGTDDDTWGVTFETGDLDMAFGAYQEGFHYNDDFQGHIDEFRITIGFSRYDGEFTPPTEPFATEEDTYLKLNLGSSIGINAPANSFIMPVGLGYVSRFPRYSTHRDNLEVFEYTLTFNQETDFSNLDTQFFPTLTDLQSPENTLPILEFPNIIRGGGTKSTELNRTEDVLDSGLSNRLAFSWYTYADESSEFAVTVYSEDEMWAWRTFFHYLRGSYGEFYVPTFTDDIPGVTTSGGGNTFTAPDTDMALLFGTTPDPRRSAIRLEFDDGTIEYRHITAITDNGATEDFTVSAVVTDGTPKISFLQRCRILGDTVTIEHERTDYAFIKFRYRTVLL